MKNTYVDPDGVENVSIGIIKQAKKDFIKGAKVLYGIMHYIPTEKELFADPTHHTLASDADVRWMYDAWRFIIQDPYQLFGDAGEEAIINSWTRQAKIEYYRVMYLKGAEIVIRAHKSKHPETLGEMELRETIGNAYNDFKEAKDYILSLPKVDQDEIFHEWNVMALTRARKARTPSGLGRGCISKTSYFSNMKNEQVKNIKKAKELFDEGMSVKDIAEELELTPCTIRKYIRS